MTGDEPITAHPSSHTSSSLDASCCTLVTL